MKKNIYDFKVTEIDGQEISLDTYKGKVLLIVNTASRCGYTPQLTGLQKLYEAYKEQGLEILAFPSNDFGDQEPLEGEAIQEFCSLEYRTTFPVFDKINVIGRKAHPLYKYLSSKDENGKFYAKPKWNFHKYLIDREGNLVDYFFTFTKPTSKKIIRQIEKLLNES